MIYTYQSIEKIGISEFKDRGSKFIGHVLFCESEAEAKNYIQNLRTEHTGACHVCFAWRFGVEQFTDRYSDDGEPNNSAGKPIFGQIIAHEVTNVLVAVVRYYGGTNLGVGGLINAYKTASKLAFEQATIKEFVLTVSFRTSLNYEILGSVMAVLNKWNVNIQYQGYENEQPYVDFETTLEIAEKIQHELAAIHGTNTKKIREDN